MDAQRLYTHYHRLIVTIAEQSEPDAPLQATRPLLQHLLARFDRDAEALSAESGRWLRSELAEQLELRLLRTTSAHARDVFSLALKHLE